MKNQKKTLSAILMEEGIITPEQVETALILQRTNRKRLGKILIELGQVTEEQIAEALAKQFSLPLAEWKRLMSRKSCFHWCQGM